MNFCEQQIVLERLSNTLKWSTFCVISIRDVYIGWVVGDGLAGKGIVQNCDRVTVKPKNQLGRLWWPLNG